MTVPAKTGTITSRRGANSTRLLQKPGDRILVKVA